MSDSVPAVRTRGETRFKILRSEEEIAADVERIAADIRERADGRIPVFIGLLKGGFMLLADLIRAYREPHEIDFLSVARHDPAIKDPTAVRVLSDLSANIDGRLVVVVEGIRSRGTKVEYVDSFLRLRGAGEVLHCAMVRQKGSAKGVISLDSWGFETDDDEYVVGYGLDLDERHRNLPFIGVVES